MKRTLAAVLAIVVVAAAAAAYLLAGHSNSGQAQSATSQPPSGQAGGSAAGVEKLSSLQQCSGDAVAVVYAEGQEALAEKIAELLRQQLNGHVPGDTRFCTVPASASGLEGARVLPLILVRAGNVSSRLGQLLLNKTIVDGFRPVRYDVDAVFAARVALQFNLPLPRYSVTAEALLVEPKAGVAYLDPTALEKDKQFMALTEAVFAANITSVGEADSIPQGLPYDTRPALVLRSSGDLTDGNPAVEALGDRLYAAKQIDFAKVFLQRGLAEAIEVERSAEELGLAKEAEKHPTLGSGPVHIAVFEDFMCPFCAKFYNETFPRLEGLAEEGKVTIHFLDLIVHQQGPSPRLHRLLACYYAKTRDSKGYVEAVKQIYRVLWRDLQRLQKGEINETALNSDYEKLYQELSKKLGATGNCTEAGIVTEPTRLAMKLGLTGTPSFAAWRSGSGYVVLAEGFRSKDFFEKLVAELSG
jgi:hypothetical protein